MPSDPSPRTRLDRALTERSLVTSRTEAQALIAAGLVRVDGVVVTKSSLPVGTDAAIELLGRTRAHVSRAGGKLAAALDAFGISVAGRTALDVGASTGGFTDCLLQRGAAHVVAVDVGHGQMDAALAADPRVTLREGVNARFLSPADFPAAFPLIVVDLSFISLTLVLPALAPLLAPGGDMVCLVKPQFEVGAARLGKGGIVHSPDAREDAVRAVAAAAMSVGLVERGRIVSPVVGANGNVEFLVHLALQEPGADIVN